MQNLKLVPLHRNLPEIIDKKDIYPLRKGMLPSHNPSFVQFEKIKEVIINTHTLPIEITIQDQQRREISLLVTISNITAKCKSKNLSIPLQAGKQKWLRVDFGSEYRTVEVRNKFNENKISKTSIYASTTAWKNQHQDERLNISQYSLEGLLDSLKEKERESNDRKTRGELRGLVRAKFSERANSFSHKESIHSRNQIEQSTRMASRADNGVDGFSNGKKYDSATLNFNAYFQNRDKIAKRTANTSNSLRSESHDVRFSKKNQKEAQVLECKPCKPYTPSFFEEPSQFIPFTQGKARPRFYQQIPFSHEQIELKRKKFDSQFISKKENPQLNITKTNESEVTEDIIKCENSRLGHPLQDTFERGMEHNQKGNGGDLQSEESGTLCQSVFE